MIMTIIYGLLAILGLGFLVFIHEMGHYVMARKVGMRVEAFAIGFGRPIIRWTDKRGVDRRLCFLTYGGYLKIAGMQKEGSKEPAEIKDGFFGSSPWKRIQVAFMGPFVNIVFAFLAFTVLWFSGGREKSFTEFTSRIGWVDKKSALYQQGVRPGDAILELNHKPFSGAKDLLLSSVIPKEHTAIHGLKIDYLDQEKAPFSYTLTPYQDPRQMDAGRHTLGIFAPASYLIYEEPSQKFPGAPLAQSGIQPKDRIFWVDGQLIFSVTQLKALLAEPSVFLTVKRDGKIFHSKIPRPALEELLLQEEDAADFMDLRYEAGLLDHKLDTLYFIPYKLSSDLTVMKPMRFIDPKDEEKAFVSCARCPFFHPLKPQDQIIAIGGKKVHSTEELLRRLQNKQSLIVVQRDPQIQKTISWNQADQAFDHSFSVKDLQNIVQSIGQEKRVSHSGNLYLLRPIEPVPIAQFPPSDQKHQLLQAFAKQASIIQEVSSPEKREKMTAFLEKQKKQPYLGAILRDRTVRYNPSPFALFSEAFSETAHTMYSLFSGNLNPKWLSGPVGMIHVVQHSWSLGAKEALFWMGLISLNLALLNLFPIPVLDGGHIVLSCVEMVTKKPLKAKTMERLIIPFVILLIGFILFVTYHDISRLIIRFFN